MDNKQYNALFSFIWNIANDVLVHAFEKGDYKKIIMPFMVLRRIDVLLEPTKAAVLQKKEFCDNHNIVDYTPFLTQVTGYPFYNTSAFTMKTLKNEIDPQRLKMNIIEYFNGFSQDVQDIIDKFKLRQQVDNLTEAGRLGSLLEKFTDENINLSVKPVMQEVTHEDGTKEMVERLPGLDNHTMGTIFEELLRKFNEENNVTEAGEHFTPRDYVRLLGQLAVEPIKNKLTDNTYTIYDGACGTGGILTIAQEEIERVAKETGKRVRTSIFGQELQPDTYATCKADLMISGNINKFTYRLGSVDHQYIAFGSTISQDGHAGETFDFCISNPPFGTPWKEDLKNWGISDKKEIIDPRFYDGTTSFVPAISDCQMLFLANNISKMKDTPLGTRIVEVHNGSSLYSSRSTDGDNALRKYILDNDLLEAIVAIPEGEFYNTPLNTYIWILTNRKEERRRGKIQLINAWSMGIPQRPKLGKKDRLLDEDTRNRIVSLLVNFEENEFSKIVTPNDLGYWEVQLCHEHKNAKGKVEYKKIKNEKEYIPLNYPGGINGFIKNELHFLGDDVVAIEHKLFYEISFTKFFYRPIEVRTFEDVKSTANDTLSQISLITDAINTLKKEIIELSKFRPYSNYKKCEIQWVGSVPNDWVVSKVREHFIQRVNKVSDTDYPALSVTKSGIVPQLDTVALSNAEGDSRKEVRINDFVVNSRSDRKGSCGVSNYNGSVSLINIILEPVDVLPAYVHYLFRTNGWVEEYFKNGQGIAWDVWTTNYQKMKNMSFIIPPLEEQRLIVEYVKKIDTYILELRKMIDVLGVQTNQIISDVVTGQIKVC